MFSTAFAIAPGSAVVFAEGGAVATQTCPFIPENGCALNANAVEIHENDKTPLCTKECGLCSAWRGKGIGNAMNYRAKYVKRIQIHERIPGAGGNVARHVPGAWRGGGAGRWNARAHRLRPVHLGARPRFRSDRFTIATNHPLFLI